MIKRGLLILAAGVMGIMAVLGLAGCGANTGANKKEEIDATVAEAEGEMAEGADSDWYMKALTDKDLLSKYSYCTFIDVNKNGVPALIMSTTKEGFIGDEDRACLIIYDKGEPKTVKEIGGKGGESFYYNEDENVLTYFSRLSGEGHIEICELKDGEMKVVKTADQYSPHHAPDVDNADTLYRVDGKEVSEKEFTEVWDKYAKDDYKVTYEAIKDIGTNE